mmetsp:Transcript_13270/g.9365  ORF Transcript_13270/g.9365 Transcript_13270/m.9365 type:complete len:156 (-) Transcript_13270:347-814(-)|eukprot:CAMPEP_0116879614 /NCGR_PEP_ID=MMETSP0463-20121206/11424_1 /TAXON_ID=181622 /ORGANISM="Strombidinopsis sp, Strain SopsisLIS2011" /LENGTH=155 /DNA_ID=CAMNT_0004529131 /DNA_START=1077 /DNA_END=1544 /DNA_ORIENTATION=-
MRTALEAYGGNFEKAKLSKILTDLDYESTGRINYTDFISATITQSEAQLSDIKVDQIFKQFDIDDDDKINHMDLKQAFNKLGRDITEDEINLIMKKHDKDQDGNITKDEFVFMIRGVAKQKERIPAFFSEDEFKNQFEELWNKVVESKDKKADIE